MTTLAVAGSGIGLGLLLVVGGLSRRHATDCSRLWPSDAGAAPVIVEGAGPGGIRSNPSVVGLGRLLSGLVLVLRPSGATIEQDLAICGRNREEHDATTALSAGGGVIVMLALASTAVAGLHLPSAALPAAAVIGAVIGAAGAMGELRRSARELRRGFVRALSCWLELVALAQAAGMGIEGALDTASRISAEPPFRLIRGAIDRSRHAGTTPWDGIARLGERIGVGELNELAASLGLAGTEGARVRASLRAKSAALRLRLRTEAEARANSTTERLFLPSIVIMLGFLVFLMYPAAAGITRVL